MRFKYEEDGDRTFFQGNLKPNGERWWVLKDTLSLTDDEPTIVGKITIVVYGNKIGWSCRANFQGTEVFFEHLEDAKAAMIKDVEQYYSNKIVPRYNLSPTPW